MCIHVEETQYGYLRSYRLHNKFVSSKAPWTKIATTYIQYNVYIYVAGIIYRYRTTKEKEMIQSTTNTLVDIMVGLPVMSTGVPQGLY